MRGRHISQAINIHRYSLIQIFINPCPLPTPMLPAWRDTVEARRLHSQKLEVAVGRWAHAALAAAFHTWRETAQEQHGQHRALARFYHTALAKAWSTWQWYADERRVQQAKLQSAVEWWLHGKLSAAFVQVSAFQVVVNLAHPWWSL